MDRLTSLRVFGRVVESGGFSAAARRLNMSVTSVSNHVQALEDGLGVRLLNRTTRKVSLTEVGKAYYERATRILADLEEADRLASALQERPQGTLRLYADRHITGYVAPVISEFLRLYPSVSIDMTVGYRMGDMIDEGFDVAVRPLPPPDSSLIVRSLAPWRNLLCCSPAYVDRHGEPQKLADLTRHNCLRYAYYPFGDEWRFTGPDGEPESVHVTGSVVTNSGETLLRLALDGHGILFGPGFIVAERLRDGGLVQILKPYVGVEFAINATYPHRHHLSTKVRRFIDLLAERAANYAM